MFNVKKFQELTPINRLKKLAYHLRDILLQRTSKNHFNDMIEWLNKNEAYRFPFPQDSKEIEALYQELMKRIYENDPYQDSVLFDTIGKPRQIYDITVILDNIRSPFNVGSFFRTCESLGVKELWLLGITPTPRVNHKIQRTAKGAIIPYQEINHYKQLQEIFPQKRLIIGIEKTNHSQTIQDFSTSFPCFNSPLFLIFGNEEFGISQELISLCQAVYHIPLLGHKNSLNVSVAAGISLYQIITKIQLMSGFKI